MRACNKAHKRDPKEEEKEKFEKNSEQPRKLKDQMHFASCFTKPLTCLKYFREREKGVEAAKAVNRLGEERAVWLCLGKNVFQETKSHSKENRDWLRA